MADEKFKAAAEAVRKWTKKPSDSEMLEIYSLYKQATVGDVNIPKPKGMQDGAKWDAWSSKKGINSTEAKEKYIAKVESLRPKYS